MPKFRFGVFGRLLALVILGGVCLGYLPQEGTLADTEYMCDLNYFQCYVNSFGDPNGSCISTAEACMVTNPRYYFYSGPICDPSGRDINTTCLRGNIHMWDGSYADLAPYFENCMAAGAGDENVDSKVCCKQTADYFSALYCP